MNIFGLLALLATILGVVATTPILEDNIDELELLFGESDRQCEYGAIPAILNGGIGNCPSFSNILTALGQGNMDPVLTAETLFLQSIEPGYVPAFYDAMLGNSSFEGAFPGDCAFAYAVDRNSLQHKPITDMYGCAKQLLRCVGTTGPLGARHDPVCFQNVTKLVYNARSKYYVSETCAQQTTAIDSNVGVKMAHDAIPVIQLDAPHGATTTYQYMDYTPPTSTNQTTTATTTKSAEMEAYEKRCAVQGGSVQQLNFQANCTLMNGNTVKFINHLTTIGLPRCYTPTCTSGAEASTPHALFEKFVLRPTEALNNLAQSDYWTEWKCSGNLVPDENVTALRDFFCSKHAATLQNSSELSATYNGMDVTIVKSTAFLSRKRTVEIGNTQDFQTICEMKGGDYLEVEASGLDCEKFRKATNTFQEGGSYHTTKLPICRSKACASSGATESVAKSFEQFMFDTGKFVTNADYEWKCKPPKAASAPSFIDRFMAMKNDTPKLFYGIIGGVALILILLCCCCAKALDGDDVVPTKRPPATPGRRGDEMV